MSDSWNNMQAIKNNRNGLREKLQKLRKERQVTLSTSTLSSDNSTKSDVRIDPDEAEQILLHYLTDSNLKFPLNSQQILSDINRQSPTVNGISHTVICEILNKFLLKNFINANEKLIDEETEIDIVSVDCEKMLDILNEFQNDNPCADFDSMKINAKNANEQTLTQNNSDSLIKRPATEIGLEESTKKLKTSTHESIVENSQDAVDDVLSLISTPSIREKEIKKIGEEILDLLSKPTAKERSLTEKFRSQGGTQLTEFCIHRTLVDCANEGNHDCKKLHFKKIIETHTEESLGDCSYLNTCFHMNTCKYVHYEVDKSALNVIADQTRCTDQNLVDKRVLEPPSTILYPPQWIQCDLRYFDMNVLGKFAVVMADPPWDIHMELPYGTLSDDEMRCLGIPKLQDEGLLFLWVTGRAMELGRECLSLWGYEYVDEIVWVKTNQLQRIIRTGRTGHWLNHGKEHCLQYAFVIGNDPNWTLFFIVKKNYANMVQIGMKGNPKNLNRGIDCDVIVAEVRDTSHKPDEIYGIIERLSPGTRKIELFGRFHNVQPNWITLGNQVQGVHLVDPNIISTFQKKYPDGNCMGPLKST